MSPSWIVESHQLGWTDGILRAADVIVWLDLPWRIAGPRMVKRHVEWPLATRQLRPGIRKLARSMFHAWRYYSGPPPEILPQPDVDGPSNRAATGAYLARYGNKVFRCCPRAEVESFVDWITASASRGTLLSAVLATAAE